MNDYKKDFEKSIDFIEWQNDMLKKQADRIAELEKFNKAILKKGGYPHKPLSDEEIKKLIINTEGLNLYSFARAIEERHGIK